MVTVLKSHIIAIATYLFAGIEFPKSGSGGPVKLHEYMKLPSTDKARGEENMTFFRSLYSQFGNASDCYPAIAYHCLAMVKDASVIYRTLESLELRHMAMEVFYAAVALIDIGDYFTRGTSTPNPATVFGQIRVTKSGELTDPNGNAPDPVMLEWYKKLIRLQDAIVSLVCMLEYVMTATYEEATDSGVKHIRVEIEHRLAVATRILTIAKLWNVNVEFGALTKAARSERDKKKGAGRPKLSVKLNETKAELQETNDKLNAVLESTFQRHLLMPDNVQATMLEHYNDEERSYIDRRLSETENETDTESVDTVQSETETESVETVETE